MIIKLVKLSEDYKKQLFDMMDEWCSFQSEDKDDKTPWAIFKNDYHDFDNYLDKLDIKEEIDGHVPTSTFFALDTDRNIFVGAVNIRHKLNDHLLSYGGHIGDGIRPSERRKGFGTEIIRLALKECEKLGIDKVLMTCDKDNIASRKTITNNGGILENEVIKDNEVVQRYWINLKKHRKPIISRWLDKIDDKAESKGKATKFWWQIAKFLGVGGIMTVIQLILVNSLYFLMKGWTTPLSGPLGQIFTEEIMGPGHSTWGYILPFFLSNFIANTVGYILNKHRTFKSDAPRWHYLVYIVVLVALIISTTWVQGLVANLMIKIGVEGLGPTIASMTAGFIQMIVLYPLQKFVLLKEKKEK